MIIISFLCKMDGVTDTQTEEAEETHASYPGEGRVRGLSRGDEEHLACTCTCWAFISRWKRVLKGALGVKFGGKTG